MKGDYIRDRIRLALQAIAVASGLWLFVYVVYNLGKALA